MNPQIPGGTFDTFFAWAPWVVGIAIYLLFYFAKRQERVTQPPSIGQTYSCASCGRRGARDHMVAQDHGGAVSWYCGTCATSQTERALV